MHFMYVYLYEAMLLKSQLRRAGHVSRMEDHCLPKIALYGEVSSGHRGRGAPKKRYKGFLKKSLGACQIEHHQWSSIPSDSDAWRSTVHQAVFLSRGLSHSELDG